MTTKSSPTPDKRAVTIVKAISKEKSPLVAVTAIKPSIDELIQDARGIALMFD